MLTEFEHNSERAADDHLSLPMSFLDRYYMSDGSSEVKKSYRVYFQEFDGKHEEKQTSDIVLADFRYAYLLYKPYVRSMKKSIWKSMRT